MNSPDVEIILARHGKPDLALNPWAWIAPQQIGGWIQAYDQADIIVEDVPADTLKEAAMAGILVSSTLRRCVRSAEVLSQNRSFLAEDVFSEAYLPYWDWRFPKLPASAWWVICRLAWLCGSSANTESLSQATLRARKAAGRLAELARENGSVFLVGHGMMTILIARQLLALGWSGPKQSLHRYWQFTVYRLQP